MGINKWALEKWIEALRSGEYKQGYEALCNVDPDTGERYYCCLGVAADTLQLGEWNIPSIAKNKGGLRQVSFTHPDLHFGMIGSIPWEVWNVIGLPLDQEILVNWNDEKYLTFDEIADRLEKYLDE